MASPTSPHLRPSNVPNSNAGVQEVIVAQGAGSYLHQRIGSKHVFEKTELLLDPHLAAVAGVHLRSGAHWGE
jgi:hypothetical protein